MADSILLSVPTSAGASQSVEAYSVVPGLCVYQTRTQVPGKSRRVWVIAHLGTGRVVENREYVRKRDAANVAGELCAFADWGEGAKEIAVAVQSHYPGVSFSLALGRMFCEAEEKANAQRYF